MMSKPVSAVNYPDLNLILEDNSIYGGTISAYHPNNELQVKVLYDEHLAVSVYGPSPHFEVDLPHVSVVRYSVGDVSGNPDTITSGSIHITAISDLTLNCTISWYGRLDFEG